MHSFVGSVARQRPIDNNKVEFCLGSVLRVRCCGNIFLLVTVIHHLLIIIKYKIPGVKWSRREAEIHPELQKGEAVKSRHA
jgi:hypothetical protein